MYYDKDITLLEALTGVDFLIEHLNGKLIRVQNTKGQVINPGDKMTVIGMGMPFYKSDEDKYGNLFIKFKIIFPDAIDENE